ncbi:MAG: phosphate acyltransferase PlsX [Gammaproteobacteria bacterium]|nr:phosphate acyltransferase PlsX [Gammaproteobacteria bacterium]NNC66493.1 phosphate acyltransferase PlsX [Gammaproteobacteria bacterium]
MTNLTVSLDAMGGDFGVEVVAKAAVDYLEEHQDISLILVGNQQEITAELNRLNTKPYERLKIHHASQKVDMDEPPSQALRNKKDSSMRVAIDLVKAGVADAAISAGNTGALMATARYVLKTLPGIDRPAITSTMPSMHGKTYMLDLGANVGCSSQHLLQFAVMGSVLANAIDEIKFPKVGLLNVGEEEIKGNEQVKEAHEVLRQSGLNYIGYVEGDDIFCGEVEVVVCDGFVGNVSLKTSEGVAKIVAHYAREEFSRNILTKLCGLFALPVLKAFKKRIDPRRYNGASLLGLRGVVVKSHGGADAYSFQHAIEIAHVEASQQVPKKIESRIEEFLTQDNAA